MSCCSLDLIPPARRASATGIVMSFAWLGHGLGGWQGGATFDATGGYTWGFAVAVAAGAMAIFVLGVLRTATRHHALKAHTV